MTAATPGQAARAACEAFWRVIRGRDGLRDDPADAWPWAQFQGAEEAWQAAVDAAAAAQPAPGDEGLFPPYVPSLRALATDVAGKLLREADAIEADVHLNKFVREAHAGAYRTAAGRIDVALREGRGGNTRTTVEVVIPAAQPAPELQLGPCTLDGHDGEHLRLNTHGHWLCAIMLTNMLVAADVITDPQPAPELATVDLHRWYAVIQQPDGTSKVIGHTDDGLGYYDSVAEWEAKNT